VCDFIHFNPKSLIDGDHKKVVVGMKQGDPMCVFKTLIRQIC